MLEITVRKIASAPLLFAHKVSHLLSQRKAAKNRLVGEELLLCFFQLLWVGKCWLGPKEKPWYI